MELLLLDSKGDRIQASIKPTLMQRFKDEIQKYSCCVLMNFDLGPNVGQFRSCSHPYKISFIFYTVIKPCEDLPNTDFRYNFCPFLEIVEKKNDGSVFVDIIGEVVAMNEINCSLGSRLMYLRNARVSKAFKEDRIGLEEYVFTLRDTVGLEMLTEAIGIGKGKKDLTNCALETTKLNRGASANSQVRIRNDLPFADIVKFLTGEYRMSKTRSSDLFWEAVWPRLLARGWHSEQPKDGPKNSLVFLTPEANKFSRRKMSKGNHYFESLTDVLNKVALDPTLLELKTDEDREKIGSKEELIKNDLPVVLKEFGNSSQNSKKKKRYLQPRSKTRKSQEVTMFMIVDTSEANGVEGCTLKELRSLPVETGDSVRVEFCQNSTSYLSESEDKLSDESENKAETTAKSMASRVCETQYRKKNPVTTGTQVRPNPSEADQNAVLMTEECIDQDQTLKLSSIDSSAEDSSCGRNEDRQTSPGRPEREDFDLNVSQISLEPQADATDTVITNGVHNSESSCAQQSSVQMDAEMQCNPQELQVSGDLFPGQRQSTRTRPLTTKALEAFAFGYLGNSKKKRKATEESRTKSAKRIRRHSLVSSEFRNGTVEDGSTTDENE